MTAPFTITIPAGGKWSAHVSRGKQIQITAAGERANLACLLYSSPFPSERYNMPDTLKAQHTAMLTAGHVLMSDQGRVLASITGDTAGWHDPLSGYTTRQGTDEKYGLTHYQTERNGWYRSGEENLTVELFRHNLTARDLIPPVNLFSKVVCELDGTLRYEEQPAAERTVTLRTEMDLLVIFSNTPNPLDPSDQYPEAPVHITITDAAPLLEDDLCVNHCGENRRAFENTWNANALLKGAY
ncbi:urea amidolyase associated protein UAAP1 [Paenibacillus pinistramenti]|uniref:urea amidolyase associated protein UAAP1 n=1 Tax=Paenibacillus pinistramenti TaxID=1768003 RepID=UPI001107F10D|nr:urea amidolyase associated protein UAAP1 [Paenibacillus pinistramenti]